MECGMEQIARVSNYTSNKYLDKDCSKGGWTRPRRHRGHNLFQDINKRKGITYSASYRSR